jgi:hypothetical protein
VGIARIAIARSVRLARWHILEHETRIEQQRKWIAALEADSDLAASEPDSREAMAKQAHDALARLLDLLLHMETNVSRGEERLRGLDPASASLMARHHTLLLPALPPR